MACPDRTNDLRILAEIERRKKIVAEVNVRNGYEEAIEWEGSLFSYTFTPNEENSIVLIEKIEEGRYRAIINKPLETAGEKS